MSTSPVRRLVLQNLVTSLKGISTGAGYITTPTVYMTGVAPQVFNPPILCVHERSGSTVEMLTHDPSWLHRVFVRVHCIAVAKGEGQREGALADLVDDVLHRLLKEDNTLQGSVDMLDQLEGDDTDEGAGQTAGEAVLDFVARLTTPGGAPPMTFTTQQLGTLLPQDVWITALGPMDLLAYPNVTVTLRNVGTKTITDGQVEATPISAAPEEAWEVLDAGNFKDLPSGAIKSYAVAEGSRRFLRVRLKCSFPGGTVADCWVTANR